MEIKKVKSTKKQELAEKKAKGVPDVSIDDQLRLAQIMNDSPTTVSLNGTRWEIRALKMGTQYLIAERVLEITKAEEGSFGDILNHFAKSVPAVLDVITFAMLNSKRRIYKDGCVDLGFSDEFYATRQTLEWECDYTKFGEILLVVLSKLDISFFTQSLGMLDIFRQRTTKKKREALKTTNAQK